MKQRLQRYFTLFMAIVVLTASMGVGVVEHNCQLKGKSVSLFSSEKSSCHSCSRIQHKNNDTSKTQFKRTKCCAETYSVKKINIVLASKTFAKAFFQFSQDFVNTDFNLENWFCLSIKSNLHVVLHAVSFSSLFYGRSLLSFVQSFLI